MTSRTYSQLRLTAITGGLLFLAVAGQASAQSFERLAEADTNRDGNITWQEMLDMRASIFQRLDRDGNGVVDKGDSPGFGPGRSRFEQAFNSVRDADSNRDGRITRSEMLNAPAPAFENGDLDRDKVLSAKELAALRQQASSKR